MVWRIDETSEWTHDQELAESALESGLSACEYDEADLIALVERLETKISKQEQMFQELYGTINERLVDGVNAVPQVKNTYFSLILHDLKECQKKIYSL